MFCGVFPARLKYAEIKQLHMNGDRCEMSNYRPVSLLTSFSKIFEMVTQTRIITHCRRGGLLIKYPWCPDVLNAFNFQPHNILLLTV